MSKLIRETPDHLEPIMPNLTPLGAGDYRSLQESDRLAVRITQGLVGYLTYQNKKNLNKHLYETSFYLPCIEFIQGFGWRASHEHELMVGGIQGEIDFIATFPKKGPARKILAVEIKYFHTRDYCSNVISNTRNGTIKDVKKIRSLLYSHQFRSATERVGVLIIIARTGDLRTVSQISTIGRPSRGHSQQIRTAIGVLLNANRNEYYEEGWCCDEPGGGDKEHSVICIRIADGSTHV